MGRLRQGMPAGGAGRMGGRGGRNWTGGGDSDQGEAACLLLYAGNWETHMPACLHHLPLPAHAYM